MNHISHIDPETEVAYLADLAGGWHFTGTCPICDRVNALPLTRTEAAEYEAAGVPVLEDSPRLRALLDTHVLKVHGPIQQTEWWSRPLTTDPIAGDALLGAWLGQEAHHV
jgi:hypothetical protein